LQVYRRFKRFIYQGSIPVTKTIMVLTGIFFLLYYGLQLLNIELSGDWFILTPASIFHFPWTLITYPFINPDPLALLFSLLWLWFIGGSLERIWSSWTYATFIFWVSVVTGIIMMLVAWYFLGGVFAVSGLWLPLVAITWAWAEIYPDREMLFWGIIPVRAKWLAWIEAALTFYLYARSHWLMGLASLSGILVVYLFRGKKSGHGLRYWAWSHGFSFQGWREKRRREARRKKLKIIKH
jgi:membrane associated rhomboid family serine protease